MSFASWRQQFTSVGLPSDDADRFAQIFADNNVDHSLANVRALLYLPALWCLTCISQDLTHDALRSIGISNVNDRIKILRLKRSTPDDREKLPLLPRGAQAHPVSTELLMYHCYVHPTYAATYVSSDLLLCFPLSGI
jgi:hypothetical protein